jgi:hypothetical protein
MKFTPKAFDKTAPLTRRYVGQIRRVQQRPDEHFFEARYRWITREENGKFYGRAPKMGTLISHLKLKRDADYHPEKLLPSTTRVFPKAAGHPQIK